MPRTRIKTIDILDKNVTSPKLEDNITISGNLTITGNLTVNGTTTTINTHELTVEDNIITLNSGYTGSPESSPDAGIEVNRGTTTRSYILWRENYDMWQFSHPIYINLTSDSTAITIRQANNDVNIWRIEDSTSNNRYGFNLIYKGTETGDNNALELWADNQSGTPQRVYRIQQSGAATFYKPITFDDNIILTDGKTVDGVDISAHHSNNITNVKHVTDDILAALAGTSGTAPSANNKFVDNADTRLTNARTPIMHGDERHNALSYFKTFSDGSNVRSATASNQSVKFEGSGATTVTVGDATGYAASIRISSANYYLTGTSFADEKITYTRNGLSDLVTDLSGTWLKLSSTSEQVVDSDIRITGNLIVQGTTTTINTTEISVADNIITLNSDVTGTPTENAGIEIERGTSPNVAIIWNENTDRWTLTEDGINYYRIVTQTFTGDLTLNGNLRIGGSDAGPNYIWFRGTTGDAGGTSTYIGERIYGGTEASELVLFKGNDYSDAAGPDRIRLIGANIVFDTYAANITGTFEQVATNPNVTTKMIIKTDGKVGIGTTNPAQTLDVNGYINASRYYMGNSRRDDKWDAAYEHSQSPHLQLGETETTAYRGDRGKIAYDHSQSPHAPVDAPSNAEFTAHTSNTTVHITAAERAAWNAKQNALGYTPLKNTSDTLTGTLSIVSEYGTAIDLKAGGTSDHVYMRFFADSDNISTPSGYIGYGTASTTTLTIKNSNGDIVLSPGTSADVKVGDHTVWHSGNLNPSDYLALSGGNMTGSIIWLDDQDYKGIYWGSKHEDASAHSGNWGYIRQSTQQGQLEIGSSGVINFYDSDTRTLVATLDCNNRTFNINGILKENGVALSELYSQTGRQKYARIVFPKYTSRAVFEHDLGTTNYIVMITSNSPEAHYYYSDLTENSVTINLDDEAYEELVLDVAVIATPFTEITAIE